MADTADAGTAPERREWTVTGMDCAACGAKIRGAVERLPGVGAVDVRVMGERLALDLQPGTTPPERIEGAVRALGYGIAPRGAARPKGAGAFVVPGAAVAERDDAAAGAAARRQDLRVRRARDRGRRRLHPR